MKKAILYFPLFLVLAVKSFGQSTFTKLFSYDQNGNRIREELLFAKVEKSDNPARFMASATDTLINLIVKIFPNPTNDKVFVSLIGDETSQTVQAMLMSSTGSLLEEKRFDNSTVSFNLTGKASGLYFLEISTDNTKHLWKIIKR